MLETARLRLGPWRLDHFEPLAAMLADEEVTRFIGGTSGPPIVWSMLHARIGTWVVHGFGHFAVEEKASRAFVGITGLLPVTGLPAAPAVEIGWRLRHESWGKGYASEAARACLEIGFVTLGLPEIVSFAVVANARSRAVMERIGMVRDEGGDFDHPALPEGHPFRRHVLYRITRAAWQARRDGDRD